MTDAERSRTLDVGDHVRIRVSVKTGMMTLAAGSVFTVTKVDGVRVYIMKGLDIEVHAACLELA